MKNAPTEIHFDCPKCKRPMSGDRALLGELINCPDCNEPFTPTRRIPEPAPKPVKPEIRLRCPKCDRPMFVEKKALLQEFVNCPNCAASFPPAPARAPAKPGDWTVEVVPGATAPSPALAAEALSRAVEQRAEKIRHQAEFFTTVAILFSGVGVLVAFGSAGYSISIGGAGNGFIVAASLIGLSLWFYLIAQIIHIRANTEK